MFKINDEVTCFDTTLLDWSPAHVVEVAHQQASAEACFRQMNDLDNCAFQLDQEQADGAVEAVDVNLLVGPVADRAPRWDEVQECLVVPTLSVARTDRRVRRTRELLRGALLSLIQEKGYDSITVQDILDRADVGRSTFYAHYRDKDELLRSGFEDVRAALAAEREAAGSRVRRAELLEATLVLFRHVQRYRHLWRPMVQKGGSGLVVRILRQSSIDLVRDHFRSQFPAGAEDQARREAAIHYIVGALMGVLTWWLDNQDVTYSAEELHAMFQRLATEGIRRFLDVR